MWETLCSVRVSCTVFGTRWVCDAMQVSVYTTLRSQRSCGRPHRIARFCGGGGKSHAAVPGNMKCYTLLLLYGIYRWPESCAALSNVADVSRCDRRSRVRQAVVVLSDGSPCRHIFRSFFLFFVGTPTSHSEPEPCSTASASARSCVCV